MAAAEAVNCNITANTTPVAGGDSSRKGDLFLNESHGKSLIAVSDRVYF